MKGKQFIRGGQIFGYNTRMMVQVTNRILTWGIVGYILLVATIVALISRQALTTLWLQTYATFLEHLGYGSNEIWHGSHGAISAHTFLTHPGIKSTVGQAKQVLIHNGVISLCVGGVIYIVVMFLAIRFFRKKGEKYSHDQHISGTRLANSPNELIQSVNKGLRGVSEVKILSTIPIPSRSEFQGIFFHGSTGSGKTQAMMRLLDEIRRLGDPAIIYDKEGTIKSYFFDEELDVELNPISPLCPNWDIWQECENPMELGSLATYLIPKAVQGGDPFWVDSARTIFISMAWKIRHHEERSPIFLLQLLLTTTLDEMRNLLKGTESENLVSKEIEKTAISIKSVLATYTKALRFLEGLNQGDKPSFSIKKWIKTSTESTAEKKGWLFITSRSKYHKEVKPLISLWLGLAMQGIQSLKPNSNQRIWIVMDELASLHRLEMLSDTLADIRKFGGCVAVGIQSISQLEFLYGNQEAHAITDLLNTSLYFRSPKSRVAKWVSEDLGEQVIEEVRESQSYGPNSIRDGNTIATQRVKRNTVDSGEIMTMEDLECFVRVIGDHPIGRIKTEYIERPERSISLRDRNIDFDALEKINQHALSAQCHPEVNAEIKIIHKFNEVALEAGENEEILDVYHKTDIPHPKIHFSELISIDQKQND